MKKQIKDFPNYYITDNGVITSIFRGKERVLQGHARKKTGYTLIILCREGKVYPRYLHRLVLETFVGPCPPNQETRHLNGNPHDNCLANLCWGTKLEQGSDRVRHGTTAAYWRGKFGNLHGRTKVTDEQIKVLREKYSGAYGDLVKLGQEFNISSHHVKRIIKGEYRWQ
jgi:hypothetical protein